MQKVDLTSTKPLEPYRTSGPNRFELIKVGEDVQRAIDNLVPNENIHIPTRGRWSNHNLLEYILQKTGPASVWLTSWTISEKPSRSLVRLKESGMIRELNAIFDERIVSNCPEAFQLIKNNCDSIKLTKIHAKCVVILNDEWGVSITTSANFTRNPRIEKYVVCSDRDIAFKDMEWIHNEINEEKPFYGED